MRYRAVFFFLQYTCSGEHFNRAKASEPASESAHRAHHAYINCFKCKGQFITAVKHALAISDKQQISKVNPSRNYKQMNKEGGGGRGGDS